MTVDVDTEVKTCGECGIRWGAPAAWWRAREEDKRNFFCPNGHLRAFRERESDRLRRERDLLKQQAAQKDDEISRLRREWEASERRSATAKQEIARRKKREAAAACPCCNRSFIAMRRHLENKHPGFVSEAFPQLKVVKK